MATRLRGTFRWLATLVLLIAPPGSATAQQAPAAPPPAAGADAQVGFERRPQLSMQDEIAQAEVVLARIDQASGVVRRQLETARAARDVVKTLCLNDKLNQIDVAVRSAKDRASTLSSAVSGRDKDRARHEFMILQVLKDRVDQL
ncbi:MAG: hypothetical protein JOZ69_20440, partial [Myxococcales bacterium]|nr:hypothetical protein [Myxococcales bacterium]